MNELNLNLALVGIFVLAIVAMVLGQLSTFLCSVRDIIRQTNLRSPSEQKNNSEGEEV